MSLKLILYKVAEPTEKMEPGTELGEFLRDIEKREGVINGILPKSIFGVTIKNEDVFEPLLQMIPDGFIDAVYLSDIITNEAEFVESGVYTSDDGETKAIVKDKKTETFFDEENNEQFISVSGKSVATVLALYESIRTHQAHLTKPFSSPGVYLAVQGNLDDVSDSILEFIADKVPDGQLINQNIKRLARTILTQRRERERIEKEARKEHIDTLAEKRATEIIRQRDAAANAAAKQPKKKKK